MWSSRGVLTFQRHVLSPSSELKSMPSDQQENKLCMPQKEPKWWDGRKQEKISISDSKRGIDESSEMSRAAASTFHPLLHCLQLSLCSMYAYMSHWSFMLIFTSSDITHYTPFRASTSLYLLCACWFYMSIFAGLCLNQVLHLHLTLLAVSTAYTCAMKM
jgi:hypothetical protein